MEAGKPDDEEYRLGAIKGTVADKEDMVDDGDGITVKEGEGLEGEKLELGLRLVMLNVLVTVLGLLDAPREVEEEEEEEPVLVLPEDDDDDDDDVPESDEFCAATPLYACKPVALALNSTTLFCVLLRFACASPICRWSRSYTTYALLRNVSPSRAKLISWVWPLATELPAF